MAKLSEIRAAFKGRTIVDVTGTLCHGQACRAFLLHLDDGVVHQIAVPVIDDTCTDDGAPASWERGQPRCGGG